MNLPTHTTDLGHGIFAIDTGFEREDFDAAYLIVDTGRAAFIDTGHNAAVPRLLEALDAIGLPREAVDWVIPTHVHLDHAGGAGLLMRHLPGARALIHPRGARHLIDPSALVEGARAFFPDLGPPDREWMGFRPSIPDSLPVIGPSTRGPDIIHAFGHGHIGVTLAPVTARIVGGLISGKGPGLDIAAVSPARF